MPVRRAALAAAALLLASTPAASDGWNWRQFGFASQRFGYDSDLDAGDDGVTNGDAQSVTTLGVTIAGASERSSIVLSPGVSLSLNSSDEVDLDALNPRLSARATHAGKRYRLNASASIIPELITSRGIADSGQSGFEDPTDPDATPGLDPDLDDGDDGGAPAFEFNDTTGLRVTGRANLGASYTIDALNSVSAGVFGRARRFSGDGEDQSDTDSFGFNAGWSHRLDALTTASLNTRYTRFIESGGDNSTSDTVNVTLGLSRSLTPRMSFRGSFGGGFVSQTADGSGGGRRDQTQATSVGDARLTWRGKDSTASIGVSQSIDQNDRGELENQISASFVMSYAVNARSRVGFSAGVGAENPIFGTASESDSDEITFSAGPSYSYSLTPRWRASTGLRLRSQNEDSEVETSTFIFVQLSRSFSLSQ